MEKLLLYGSIGQSISNRASIVASLTTKLIEQEKSDSDLKKELMKIAPKSVHTWLEENEILDTLFIYGKCSTNIHWGEYGFITFEDVKIKMKQLSKAWNKIVSISVGKEERGRVGIKLGAIM